MEAEYANIIVDISHEKVDRPFQYRIPQHLRGALKSGMQVRIPFGRGNKLITGYIMEITDKAEYDSDKLKEIAEPVGNSIQAEGKLIRLAWWMKKQYGSTMIAAMKTVLPVKETVKAVEKRIIGLAVPAETAIALYRQFTEKHQQAKARLLMELVEVDRLPYELATAKLNISPQTIRSLLQKNIITVETTTQYRNPIRLLGEQERAKILTSEQSAIMEEFANDYQKGRRGTYLLHGITGSGKTEVYIEMIRHIIRQGREAIVLIPEIALTYQTVLRFYRQFGNQVSVVNSKLSKGERFDQFERAKKGEIKIMIGPRSALFTPFSNLGLIIIDEEHEGSYKSDTLPKYHARETAIEIAAAAQASVVLGSATPSMEAYYKAKSGEYKLFVLKQRQQGARLPQVDIVDLREELKNGNRSVFSENLKEKIKDRLNKGQQTMLFLNRRGYAGFISCRACGYVVKCPHCDVSLTDHRNGRLVCHYCGYETESITKCPQCSSKYILGFKAGTQQVEELLQKEFPTARILRMDGDTTKKKDDYEKILSRFASQEADVLIGTQMIVKGHDFKNVTLVGVLAADLSLAAGDYRAAERTFQLLTQAAGRAGRSELPGQVVIQTYQPEHYSVVHAARQDYEGFYEEEITYRQLMGYPPASNMLAVLVQSKNEEIADESAAGISAMLKEEFYGKQVLIIGPAPASIGKINDVYRRMVYIKHRDYDMLISCKDKIESYLEEDTIKVKPVSVYFDFNPMNGY